MTRILLPLPPSLRLAGPALILGAGALLLAAPLAWPWRAGLVTLALGGGGLLWWRYLRTRPLVVRVAPDGGLDCLRADGRGIAVAVVRAGVIRPWLVSAELAGEGGRALLFVPGRALSPAAHWRLRRALIGFRADDGRRAGPQSVDLRGT